jgi:hypothetical protein
MTANGGQPTATLSSTRVEGPTRARDVTATIITDQGPITLRLRTVKIIANVDPLNPLSGPVYEVGYGDIDNAKGTLLLNYITTKLMPRIAVGDEAATQEAAFLIASHVPYEQGSSGIARAIQVLGLEIAGNPAKPFKSGSGIDMNAFTSKDVEEFTARMKVTTEN